MARVVLLIEPDVDELGVLASKLRAHGLEVAIADSLERAAERASGTRIGVMLVSSVLADAADFQPTLQATPSLANLPRFVLVDGIGMRGEAEVPRWDAEAIAKRVHALGHSVPVAAAGGDFRGDLKQVSVADLLQLLGANRRSGTLSIATPTGAGEVRLGEGDVLDAVYRRVDGEKALMRLLGQTEGSFAFAGGSAPTLRRIERSSQALLMDGMRQLDETKKLEDALALGSDALLAAVLARPDQRDIEQRVLEVLVTPHTLAELLDEVPALDLEVLNALAGLLTLGAVRRFAGGTLRIELADPERLTVLAALAQRAAPPGFEGMPRIGLAGSQRVLATVLSSLGRLSDASVVTDVPAAPTPHPLGTLRLTESVSLELVGVPLIDAFAPLWGLVLPGLLAVARLDDEPFETLEAGCRLASVPLVDGEPFLGDGGEADPERVAALVRATLERAAGGE
ncbi:MAG TPA: DUF4388 domain-containing protein [Polyangiaceae bacterium]|nr:DUF4388 domain-containing protein [Polyangiaceae bacterium]